MAIRISIYALDSDDERIADVTLPANKHTIIDAMDKAKIFGETFSHIMECEDFPELENIEFIEPPTLDELNFLAKRLEEISEDKEDITPIIAYRALLCKPLDTIGEAINRTYNLETVPVYPCKDLAEYGEIVLDNEFFEELKDVPNEVYNLLDPEKVGRAMAEREGGVFIDSYYAIADSYEPALESEQPQSLDRIEYIMKYLDNFEFDHTMDCRAYAEEFHARILPPNLDKNIFFGKLYRRTW